MDEFVRVMLDGAVLRESLQSELYETMSANAKSEHLRKMFLKLSLEEKQHERILKQMDLNALKFTNREPFRHVNLLEGIEKKKLMAHEITDINEALDFAISEEDKDNKQYKMMVNHMDFGDTREVFEELALQEARHKMQLQKVKLDFNDKDWRVIK